MTSIPLWLSRLNVRLAIMSTVLIISALTIFTYFSVEKEVDTLSAELNKQAAALAKNIAASTATYIVVKDYTSLESILVRSAEFPSVIDLQVLDHAGHTLGDVYKDNEGEVETRYGMHYKVPDDATVRTMITEEMNMVVWQPVVLGDIVGWVRTNHTLDRIQELRQEIWNHNLLVGSVVTLLTILILLIYLQKPMHLIKASAEFADGLDVYAGEKLEIKDTFYEINRLAAALNRTSLNLKAKNDALNEKIIEQQKFTEELERRVLERTEELSIVRDEAVHANKSKSEFLANMSHEIRTPLTAIIGFSESLLDSDQTIHERVDSINRIIRAGKHLLRIINEILDLSKIEANKIEVERISVSLPDVFQDIHSLVSLLAEEKGLSFSIDCDFPIPATIQTDPVRLKQILINLCNNAVKFTSKGGIALKVTCDESEEKLTIKVNDTGIGLSEKQINKLFKPFSQADSSTTRQYGGTGLGLHLSKQFAEKLGGDLQVESLVDVGSSFILTISTGSLDGVGRLQTCPDFGKIELPKIVEGYKANLHGLVLLTEDNLDNQRLVSLYLKRLGLKTEIANNGKEALDRVDDLQPDLVLMDIQMPVMDGLTTTKRLRERGFNKPIVALTANALKQEQQECYNAGCNDVCTKPIDQGELIAVLSKYLTPVIPSLSSGPPICSSLLEDDPEMIDLIVQYVEQLPAMVGEIMAAFEQKDIERLKSEVHALKGTSGNYGYNELFEMMKRIEFLIVTNNFDAIREKLDSLPDMVERINKGLNPSDYPEGGNISPFPGTR
jgi:signal transduction histidine kinase/CheY-like chemotaxis protein/HPt (histidine-containing phosphotransfer) domain-containing protein